MSPRQSQTFGLGQIIVGGLLLLGFGLAAFAIAAQGVADPYGLPAAVDPVASTDALMQACPLLAAILGLPLAAMAYRGYVHAGSDRPAVVLLRAGVAAVVIAAMFLLATVSAGFAAGGAPTGFSGAAHILLGYALDLWMLAMLGLFIHAFARRLWLSWSVLIVYLALVVLFGGSVVDIALIGFGTTLPVVATGHDAMPVGYEAAMYWRLYWLTIALAMWILLAFYGHRPQRGDDAPSTPAQRPRLGLALSAALLVAAALIGFDLNARKAAVAHRYAAHPEALPQDSNHPLLRAELERFDLKLDATRTQARRIALSGTLTVRNTTDVPLSDLVFQTAPLLQVSRFAPAQAHVLSRFPQALRLRLREPLPPGASMPIFYAGTVDASDPFDRIARAAVMPDAFFLPSGVLLPFPRKAGCLGAAAETQPCTRGENYRLNDPAVGRIAVRTRPGIIVPGAAGPSADGTQIVEIAGGAPVNTVIAGARFRRFTQTRDGVAVEVFLAPRSQSRGRALAAYAHAELRAYGQLWSLPDAARRWRLVETPADFGEAVAFAGGAAIGEQHLRRAAPGTQESAGTTRMILSHEIAHQWWGMSVVPLQAPGAALVLESFPQFAALQRMHARGILPLARGAEIETRNARRAIERLRPQPRPLAEIGKSGWEAYHAGPAMLADLDALGDGRLMQSLGAAYRATTGGDAVREVAPSAVLEALIEAHPPAWREAARARLWTPSTQLSEPRR